MPESKRGYPVNRGKPPVQKGQCGNPRGPDAKNLPALLTEALHEPVTATIDGERREITKREGSSHSWSTNLVRFTENELGFCRA
jgi:hypothetical protein